MSVFKSHWIPQCDGGGGRGDDESSSEDADTSEETSVNNTSNDEEEEEEEEESAAETSDEEDNEAEHENEQEGKRKSSRNSTNTPGETQRGRVTRQFMRDQLPTKRLLRSRKKSPAAGSGSKQPQVFPCPNCKKEFNSKSSVNRHSRWCKPKNPNRTPKKKAQNEESGDKNSASNKTPNSTSRKNAPFSKEGSKSDGVVKKGRGRPRKSDSRNSQTPTTSRSIHYMEESFQEQQIPEDDFMLQRSPESSPGMPDTSSESDYEQREFAANAHQLSSNRNREVSIDVENPYFTETNQIYYHHDHHHLNHHHHIPENQPQPMIMELGNQEMAIQAEGPVTCQKCNMTYRTRQGYENHFPSCVAYSSSDDEDEEVDVVDDGNNNSQNQEVRLNWNHVPNQTQAVQILQNNNNVESAVEESSEDVTSSTSENESQEEDKPSIDQVTQPVPNVQEKVNVENSDSVNTEIEFKDVAPEGIQPFAEVVLDVTLPIEKLDINKVEQASNALSVENDKTPSARIPENPVITLPAQAQVYQQSHSQTQLDHSNSQSSHSLPVPSQLHLNNVHSTTTSQVEKVEPSQFSSQVQQNQEPLQAPPSQPPPQPVQYSFPQSSSSSAAPASHSTPLLHHAQASSNTPTYTQAQLMPGTVLHNSVMQVQQQMSTSAGPPSDCYQSTGSHQPPAQPPQSNLNQQILVNNGFPQTQLRFQNGVHVQGVNGSFQVPHQLSSGIQNVSPQVPNSIQQPGQFANGIPPHIQQQMLRTGVIMGEQRMQTPLMASQLSEQQQHQQQSLPQQQAPIAGQAVVPQGQFQNGFPNHFQFQNGTPMPTYGLNMTPQQIQQYQQQQLQSQLLQQQIGNTLQNFPNQLQQQQQTILPQQQPISVPNSSMTPSGIGNHQQMMIQPPSQLPPNNLGPNESLQQQQFQQNAMQFQYLQQSGQKLIADPTTGMPNSMQQMIQNSFNGQQVNMANAPTSVPYPQQPQQQQQQLTQAIYHPQHQQQQPPTPLPANNGVQGQLNPQSNQGNFMNPMIQGSTSSDLQQQQQLHNLQQQQLLQQLQQANHSQQHQLPASGNDPQKHSQPQFQLHNNNQAVLLGTSGLQFNKPGMQMQVLQSPQQQQLQRSLIAQHSPSEGFTGSPQPQQPLQQNKVETGSPPQQQQNSIPQQVAFAQITDSSGNTYIIMAPQQNGGTLSSNNINNVLNLLPGLQTVQSSPSQQQQIQVQLQQHQQQNSQMVHCKLQSGGNEVINTAASIGGGVTPTGSAGRSGPCPCISCKAKSCMVVTGIDKFKKVLPYPSANAPALHSPTDQLKPILPNLGANTRPMLIRPAGNKSPKIIRAQKIPDGTIQLQQQNLIPSPQIPPQVQQTSPARVLPLAMKMVMPSSGGGGPPTTAIIQQQSIPGVGGVVVDGNTVNRGGVPTSSPNIAVVRPMENPLQKLTDQISQIETTFMTPPPYQPQQQQNSLTLTPPTTNLSQLGSPQQPQTTPTPTVAVRAPSPNVISQPQLQLPLGPRLTLVTASPPPPPEILSGSPNPIQQLASLTPARSPVQQQQIIINKAVQNLQPRLMLVDHGLPNKPMLSSPAKPSTPTASSTPSTPKSVGVKRRLDSGASSTSSEPSSKSIKLTLTKPAGGNSYNIQRIDGSTNDQEKSYHGKLKGENMKSLKITGRIKSGELAGTSSDILVVPCIHTVPVPDPDADDAAGANPTIAEDTDGKSEGSSAGENNNEVKPSKARLLHRAVIVYEVQSNETVLFRSSDVRAVWGYILETVQGTRMRNNLPPLPYPTTDISLRQNDPETDAAFNRLGLIHEALKFLLDHLPGKASSAQKQPPSTVTSSSHVVPEKASQSQPEITTPSSTSKDESSPGKKVSKGGIEEDESEESLPENWQEREGLCARTEAFQGRKHFDMFGWLASKNRTAPVPSNTATKSSINPLAPHSMRFRKQKDKQDKNLVVWSSKIHGRGLYTKRVIDKGEMIIEYAGEVIRPLICDMRETYYELKSMGCYMFRLNDQLIIDATMKGNAARFINHSCEPNCVAKPKRISGKDRIIIFALRRIEAGEELTYDYQFEKEEEKIPCTCGSKHCRKYLN